ncbi:hypothetical protein K505DRAFT_341657 [Melanomma pulvis-pyrius CBS 109.77]|uniref:Uncharacterized protein n=1 Tax=Melanomma pulvis-pyrius CBS 109.77 TaxID=1314802 RepID=A0A6A6WXK1_9PLEO|nr:hypothetical protein K505DRAFT_341657 [Melanomma pulvis-pyrius CBS 109.77]
MAERIAPASWIKGNCNRLATANAGGPAHPRQGAGPEVTLCPTLPLSTTVRPPAVLFCCRCCCATPSATTSSLPEAAFSRCGPRCLAVGSHRPARCSARAAACAPIGDAPPPAQPAASPRTRASPASARATTHLQRLPAGLASAAAVRSLARRRDAWGREQDAVFMHHHGPRWAPWAAQHWQG